MISQRYKNDGAALRRLNEIQLQAKADILEKVRTGIYIYEVSRCPVCGDVDFELLSEKDRYGLYFPVCACRRCGLVQTNPRMNQESYGQFYCDDYRRLYGGVLCPSAEWVRRQIWRGRVLLNRIKSECHWPNSLNEYCVIDVGCGAGGLLKPFHDHGAAVRGYDLGELYVEYGIEQLGLDLRIGGIRSESEAEAADLIIYAHVLEHILDLPDELQEIWRVLKPDGLFYLEMPGLRNLTQSYNMDYLDLMQNAHTYHFTMQSLDNIMLQNGFERVCGDESIRAIYRKKKSGCIPAEWVSDYPQIIKELKRIETLRRILPFAPYRLSKWGRKKKIAIIGRCEQVYYKCREVAKSLLSRVGIYNHVYRVHKYIMRRGAKW